MLHFTLCRSLRFALAAVLLGFGCGDDDRADPPDGSVRGDAAAARDGGRELHDVPDAADEARDPADGGGAPDAALLDAASDAATDADATSDAAEPDLVSPVLLSSLPADGDDNVGATVIPTLTFSEPVTISAGSVLLRQTSPARALAFTASTSDDQRNLELRLDEAPDLPSELTIELGPGIVDLAGNPLAPSEIHFALPVWQRLGASANRDPLASASDVRIALDGDDNPVLLGVQGAHVYASRWRGGAFEPLGAALDQSAVLASAGEESRVALAIDLDGAPVAAFREAGGVAVVRWEGAAWQPLADADPESGGSYAPALALTAAGEPVVAFDALDPSAQPLLRVRAWTGASWQTLADLAVDAHGVRLSGDGHGDFTLAYQSAAAGIVALRWSGSALVPLAAGGSAQQAVSGSFALSATGAQTFVSAEGRGTVHLEGSAWRALPRDLGFTNSSAAFDRVLSQASDGSLLAAFSETPPAERASRLFVQRLDGERFQPLGPALNRDREAFATQPALAVDGKGAPVVAFLETPFGGGATHVFVSRFNGDPARPPTGLRERSHDDACLATTPQDGSLLRDTGCFADTLARTPVDGFVPFDVVSPLWSDGAFKRRFFMLPAGATIAYRDPGIWTFPAGTILIKEFAIEARRGDASTIRPVETRFLIVRDGGDWDRFSYQWNQDASEAVLRPASPATPLVDFMIEDEAGTSTVQTHFFPSRAQCLSCHEAPGTVLGPQTAMLDRNFDYGSTVDNQLRSLQRLGVFGSSFLPDALALARAMPNPSDTTYSTEARLRAYMHSNCSGCHHPLEALDLRISVSTLDTGLCSKIVKGDLDASVLYWRDVRRGYVGQPGVAPMPPLGTLVGNPLLEPLLSAWILDPQNPCP